MTQVTGTPRQAGFYLAVLLERALRRNSNIELHASRAVVCIEQLDAHITPGKYLLSDDIRSAALRWLERWNSETDQALAAALTSYNAVLPRRDVLQQAFQDLLDCAFVMAPGSEDRMTFAAILFMANEHHTHRSGTGIFGPAEIAGILQIAGPVLLKLPQEAADSVQLLAEVA
ncbi:MAG TPA: hypothetical protein VN495_01260 [Candidatus Paceibacterota bacterium]|nr:hypothetical protein [Candidatus Paceibacterota bacterium]